jgi:nudix-type nucleoside diphosphatase (YffH/AdpP family)
MADRFKLDIVKSEVVARLWSRVTKYTVNYTHADGRQEILIREVVDHGHAAAVLALDPVRQTVLLVRQIRMAAYVAGHTEPLLEVCAGLLDGDPPETCALREGEEELGYRLRNLRKVCDAFASPGALTERITLFLADYSTEDRVGPGGGLRSEGEDIEVVEIPLAEANAMIANGDIVDAKTIILIREAWHAHQV